MKRRKPTVRDGVLRTGGLDVRVTSADFLFWLNANRSLVFEGEFGRFSAYCADLTLLCNERI